MKKLTMKQIEKGTGGRLVSGSDSAAVLRVCTDSREAAEGDLFIPLIGENHDAHDFIPQVVENGCSNLIVSDREICRQLEIKEDLNIVFTADTTAALQKLAEYYLTLLDLKKIAVTGSTGKTSTRDLTWYVCSEKYKCQKNVRNLNNHIGVPLTILSFEEDTEVGIIEMGMDKLGEIDFLADISRPDIGIITNIGMAHIENLGSQEGIFKAKMELTKRFGKDNTLIVHQDGEFLTKERVQGVYRLITTGLDGKSDYIISHINDFGADGIQFTLEHQGKTQNFRLPVPGRHNAFNGALAVAAGAQLGISMEEAARGLSKVTLTDKRLTVRGKDGIKVIDDTYNASPDSMKSAVDVLMNTRGLRSVAILGDMFELGDTSGTQHELVGRYAAEAGVEVLITVGKDAERMAQGAKAAGNSNVLYFKNKKTLYGELRSILQKGDVILIKGSRGMEMEKIVKKIME